MIKKYELNEDHPSTGLTEGEIVYDYIGCTYGLVSEDTRFTGIEHIAVTRNSDGISPFVTVPLYKLNEIKG